MDRKRDSRTREIRREPVQSSSSVTDKSSRLRMDAYSGRAGRQKPASPPRRKEIDNVMKKARREGTMQSQYWTKKLLEVEEKDPNRWRHSGYKELYGEKSSSRSRSRSPVGGKRPLPSKPRTGPRSPPLPSSRPRGKSRSASYSPPRNVSGKPASSSRPPARGRPHTPPTKPVSKSSGGRPKSPGSGSGSESLSSCSDESCSVCSPKHGRRKNSARSRSRSFSVPRSRPAAPSGKMAPKTSSATIGRKPPSKDRARLEATRSIRDRSSPPRDPRGPPPSPPRSKVRRDSVGDKNIGGKRKMLAAVKVEGQAKKKRPVRPGSPADSESDDSSSSSDASGNGAPKLTLSERFGKMAQWSIDRRDIDSVKNMRITKDSDSTDFKVVIEGPDEEDVYRAGAPEFGDRRFGAGYFPETMHAAPIGLTAWDDVRVRYKYYKSRGYLRDLTLDDYMKWEEWWYKYQEWLEAERYYEHWANIRARHHKSRRDLVATSKNFDNENEREPFLKSDIHQPSYGGITSINDDHQISEVDFDCLDVNFSSASDPMFDVWPPKKQKRVTETVKAGQLNIISGKFESLDFDVCENHLLIAELQRKGFKFEVKKDVSRWLIFLLIGILTALVGSFIDVGVNELSSIKFKTIKKSIDTCVSEQCLYWPYLLWVVFNAIPVLISSILVSYIEPVATGSGIPQIKCYLNGVQIPRVVRIKTLFVKVFGVILSVVGGLAVGKEGPMIHSGSIIGAGISQGKSTTFAKDFGVFRYFRGDHEKRDFVSAGAAAGVAAAFGAPIGGVLFSLEEGISFWHQSLIWRICFCSLVSTFTLNIILSTYHGHPGDLSYSGLLDFGKADVLQYELEELLIYAGMGVIGGLLGALSNHINYKLTVFRIRFVTLKWLKVLEAIIVSSVTCTVAFLLIYSVNDCKPLGKDPTEYPLQMYCGDGEYNILGALWLQTPEASVRSLFHDAPGAHGPLSIFLFSFFYFFLSCWTYGLSLSSGLFVPSLLTGAAWGRLVGVGIETMFPNQAWTDPGKYSIIGAAAQLGGIVRMPVSLTVILMEGTGSIVFGLPLMITLIMAKWVGDYFNEGIYDIHTRLQGVPLLPWEPPPLTFNIYATEIMSYPVIAFSLVEKVSRIIHILTTKSHNGFPVVDMDEESEEGTKLQSCGRYRGMILRSQLIVLLNNKVFNETHDKWDLDDIDLKIFRDAYPRYKGLDKLRFSEEEMNYHIDLRPFMNPASYTVLHCASLPKVFRLFRTLGLRHLPVLSDRNRVIGMVTRKDLARYHIWRHRGRMWLEELKILKACNRDNLPSQ